MPRFLVKYPKLKGLPSFRGYDTITAKNLKAAENKFKRDIKARLQPRGKKKFIYIKQIED